MTNGQVSPERTATIYLSELEALIRRAVREEVCDVMAEWLDGEPTIIEPGSPLDDDLTELLEKKQAGTLKFYSHAEVWGTDDELPA